jgi:predicted metal-dependent peptidase
MEKLIEKRVKKLLTVLVTAYKPVEKFFGVEGASMALVIDNSHGTLATDGKTLWVNPQFAAQKTDPELIFILVHEAFHRVARHAFRLRDIAPHYRQLMHMAADYAVNLALHLDPEFTYPVPEEGLLDTRFVDSEGRALNAETIFKILLQEQQQREQEQREQQEQEQEQGDDDSETGEHTGDADDSDDDGDADDDSESESGDSGDADSQDSDGTDPNADDDIAQATGELLPAPDDASESDAAMETAKSEVIAQTAGDMPGYLKEVIKTTMEGDADWMSKFRHIFCRTVDKSDYSMRRPNQRYASTGLIMPVLRNDAMNHVAIVTDTSGSMSADELTLAAQQVKSIIDEWNPLRTTLMQHDSKIQDTKELVVGQKPGKIEWVGRGGTSFQPVCDWANQARPDVLIWITDCCPLDKPVEPEVPVIFLNTCPNGRYWYDQYLGWGEFISLV